MTTPPVCCDFHDAPAEIAAHLARMAAEYGLTRNGQPVPPPHTGWALVPFGEAIPPEHREYIEGSGWAWPRRENSTVTPLFARAFGPVRAYAGAVKAEGKMDGAVWLEFTVAGPVDVMRYRTTPDASCVQFWSEHSVPGMARVGWNTTRSETVRMRARAALK